MYEAANMECSLPDGENVALGASQAVITDGSPTLSEMIYALTDSCNLPSATAISFSPQTSIEDAKFQKTTELRNCDDNDRKDWHSKEYVSSDCMNDNCNDNDRKDWHSKENVSSEYMIDNCNDNDRKDWYSKENVSSEYMIDFPHSESKGIQHNHEIKKDSVKDLNVGPLMYRLFKNQIYTDVTFTSKSWNSSISAHKAVLAAKSSHFAELFFSEKNKDNDVVPREVEITNMEFYSFQSLLKYIYTDELILSDILITLDIFNGARDFKIQSLLEYCEMHLESIKVTERNVCEILDLIQDKNIDVLEKKCMAYIEKNTRRIIRSDAFKTFSYSTVQRICEWQSLNIKSEVELLDAVMRWTDAQSLDEKSLFTNSLIKYIRFLSLTPQELGSIIRKYPNIFTDRDGLMLIMYLNDPGKTMVLPEWCNMNRKRRCVAVKQNPMKSSKKYIKKERDVMIRDHEQHKLIDEFKTLPSPNVASSSNSKRTMPSQGHGLADKRARQEEIAVSPPLQQEAASSTDGCHLQGRCFNSV